jgi:hypothetical protein
MPTNTLFVLLLPDLSGQQLEIGVDVRGVTIAIIDKSVGDGVFPPLTPDQADAVAAILKAAAVLSRGK